MSSSDSVSDNCWHSNSRGCLAPRRPCWPCCRRVADRVRRQARSNSLLLSWYRFRVKQLVCDTDNMASGVWRYMFPAKIGQGHSWSCHIKGYPGFDKCVVFGAKSALLKVDTKGTRPTSWMASTKCSQCLTMRSCWQHVNRYSRQTASSAKGSSCRLKSDHPTAGCCVLMGDRCSGH